MALNIFNTNPNLTLRGENCWFATYEIHPKSKDLGLAKGGRVCKQNKPSQSVWFDIHQVFMNQELQKLSTWFVIGASHFPWGLFANIGFLLNILTLSALTIQFIVHIHEDLLQQYIHYNYSVGLHTKHNAQPNIR